MRTGVLVVLIGHSLSLLAACEGQVDLGDRGDQLGGGAAGVAGSAGAPTVPSDAQTVVVGDPCILTDEYRVTFAGFVPSERTLETSLFPGKNLACLVAHFRGRVSCPLGQSQELAARVAAFADLYAQDLNATPADAGITPDEEARICHTPTGGPGYGSMVQVPVKPQCASRPSADASYYTCRCGGAEPDAAYCTCPSSFACVPLWNNDLAAELPGSVEKLSGSYCVRSADVTVNDLGEPTLAPDPACEP